MLIRQLTGPQTIVTRNSQTIVAFALVTAILLLIYFTSASAISLNLIRHGSKHQQIPSDLHTLERYGLSRTIQYARCEMIVVHSRTNSTLPKGLEVSLPELHAIDLYDRSSGTPTSDFRSETITLRMPKPSRRASASHIIFGVATTLKRLDMSLEAFNHWAGHTNTRIYAIIESQETADIPLVEEKAAALGLQLNITESSDGLDDRYFALIKLLFQERQNSQWAAIIDDDTFFLSMPNLVARLASYDHTLPHYIGGITETLPDLGKWGYMAYGGAGVFLSMPLLRRLDEVYNECYERHEFDGYRMSGDRRISHCVYKHTTTKLSVEHDLNQLDLHGDATGFYESGRSQPLSVHHWKSWFHADMAKLAVVASVCGDACLLQQWRFADGWYLTNGFSIVKYSKERPLDDMTIEKTWDDWDPANDDSYAHALAPLRPRDEGKITYRLEDAIREGDQVRQFYIHRTDSGAGDRVVELLWRLE